MKVALFQTETNTFRAGRQTASLPKRLFHGNKPLLIIHQTSFFVNQPSRKIQNKTRPSAAFGSLLEDAGRMSRGAIGRSFWNCRKNRIAF